MKWRCPHCKRQLEVERLDDLPHLPFCSERCKMADLNGWMSGSYVISRPVEEGDFGEASSSDIEPPPPRGNPLAN
ncbi:MAG: DNA gyrase inhibitor YacG [Planctomycetes bacterium]|nr:DNA gyrase inhibitor YacG [Planctomycetota bacterium]